MNGKKPKPIGVRRVGPEFRDKFILTDLLGQGTFGKVYAAVMKDGDSPVAIKKVSLYDRREVRNFQREANMQIRMGEVGLAPRVYDWWIAPSYKPGRCMKLRGSKTAPRNEGTPEDRYRTNAMCYGMLVMEPMDGSLRDAVQESLRAHGMGEEFLDDIKSMVEKSLIPLVHHVNRVHRVVHMDLAYTNIMYKEDPARGRLFYIIDWGMATEYFKTGQYVVVDSLSPRVLDLFDPDYDLALLQWTFNWMLLQEGSSTTIDFMDRRRFVAALYNYGARDLWQSYSVAAPLFVRFYAGLTAKMVAGRAVQDMQRKREEENDTQTFKKRRKSPSSALIQTVVN